MTTKPETIDEYLAPLSSEKRAALEKLRRAIQSAAPKAEECISYQIPAFRLGGKMLVAFGAAKNHCAFYPGAYPVQTYKAELKAYDTTKGTIRFPADSPPPATLVRKLVKARIAEYAARPYREVKLAQNQVWQQGEEFLRIVHLERLEVQFKTVKNLLTGEGQHRHVTKKEFCRLIKGATLLTQAEVRKVWLE